MESDGAASRPSQPAAGEQTAGGGQPSQRRRRRRRQRSSQSQAPHTYAQAAAATGELSSPPAGDPQFTTGRENLQSATHSVLPSTSQQPDASYNFPPETRLWVRSDLLQSSSHSESSQDILPPTQSQAAGAVQQLSRSAKKRRKRVARKNSLKGLTEEQHDAVQSCSAPDKSERETLTAASDDVPLTKQPIKGAEGETGTEDPSGTVSSVQQSVMDDGETHTELSHGNVTSTQQQRDQDVARNISCQSEDKPDECTYLSSFPSTEEIHERADFRRSSSTTSQTEQQATTVLQEQLPEPQQDSKNVKFSPSQSYTTELRVPRSKDDTGGKGTDDEDSPDTGSFRSSVDRSSIDMISVFEDNFRDLQLEREREEYIMAAISNCAIMVSNQTGQFTQAVRDIFGDPTVEEEAGPSGVDNGTTYSAIREIDVLEYDVTHEQRLQGLKVYMCETCLEAVTEQAGAMALTEEEHAAINMDDLAEALLAATISDEPTRQSAQEEPVVAPTYEDYSLWNLPVEEGPSTSSQLEANNSSSQGEEVAQSSQHPDPAGRGCEETSSRRSSLLKLEKDVRDLALVRVFKMRGSCRMLLNNILSLINIISLSLEAYRGVHQVVERVIRPPYAAINGVVGLVTDAAATTSECLHNALSEAERAARIHFNFSKMLDELDALIAILDPAQQSAREVPDRHAVIENLVNLLERNSAIINLEWLKTATGWSSSQAEGAAAANLEESRPETSSEGFEALLMATRSAVEAVEAAITSLDIIYATDLRIRGEIQEDTDEYDDDDGNDDNHIGY